MYIAVGSDEMSTISKSEQIIACIDRIIPVKSEIDDLSSMFLNFAEGTHNDIELLRSSAEEYNKNEEEYLKTMKTLIAENNAMLRISLQRIENQDKTIQQLCEENKYIYSQLQKAVIREEINQPKYLICIGDITIKSDKKLSRFVKWIVTKLFHGKVEEL